MSWLESINASVLKSAAEGRQFYRQTGEPSLVCAWSISTLLQETGVPVERTAWCPTLEKNLQCLGAKQVSPAEVTPGDVVFVPSRARGVNTHVTIAAHDPQRGIGLYGEPGTKGAFQRQYSKLPQGAKIYRLPGGPTSLAPISPSPAGNALANRMFESYRKRILSREIPDVSSEATLTYLTQSLSDIDDNDMKIYDLLKAVDPNWADDLYGVYGD